MGPPWLYKLFYKHYIIKVINFIEKFINPIVKPQKHDNYTRKVLYGIGEGGVGGGGSKSDHKDCFRSQKLYLECFMKIFCCWKKTLFHKIVSLIKDFFQNP